MLYSSSLFRHLVNSVPELPQACWVNTDMLRLNVAQQHPLQDDVGNANIFSLPKNKHWREHRHIKFFSIYPQDVKHVHVNFYVNLHCGDSITVLFCYMWFI